MHQEIGGLRTEMHQELGKLRTDFHVLGVGLHREMHMLTWRLIGTIVTVGTALVAATHFLSKFS